MESAAGRLAKDKTIRSNTYRRAVALAIPRLLRFSPPFGSPPNRNLSCCRKLPQPPVKPGQSASPWGQLKAPLACPRRAGPNQSVRVQAWKQGHAWVREPRGLPATVQRAGRGGGGSGPSGSEGGCERGHSRRGEADRPCHSQQHPFVSRLRWQCNLLIDRIRILRFTDRRGTRSLPALPVSTEKLHPQS